MRGCPYIRALLDAYNIGLTADAVLAAAYNSSSHPTLAFPGGNKRGVCQRTPRRLPKVRHRTRQPLYHAVSRIGPYSGMLQLRDVSAFPVHPRRRHVCQPLGALARRARSHGRSTHMQHILDPTHTVDESPPHDAHPCVLLAARSTEADTAHAGDERPSLTRLRIRVRSFHGWTAECPPCPPPVHASRDAASSPLHRPSGISPLCEHDTP